MVNGGGDDGPVGGAGSPSLKNPINRFRISSTVPDGSRRNFINSTAKSLFRSWYIQLTRISGDGDLGGSEGG